MSQGQGKSTRVYSEVRELDYAPETVALFGELSNDGHKPNTLMLESADIVTRKGEKSIIMVRAALKATCRNREVLLEALSDNGKLALEAVRGMLESFIVEQADSSVRFAFAEADVKLSLASRLRAPSSLDVVRAMSRGFEHDKGVASDVFFAAGIFAYDLVDQIERLPSAKHDELNFPDYVFWLPEAVVIVDHRTHKTKVVLHRFGTQADVGELDELEALCRHIPQASAALSVVPGANEAIAFSASDLSDISDEEFAGTIEDVKKRIVAGDVFQIVPSRTFKMPCQKSLQVYQKLRSFNPSPYMYYVVNGDFTLLGASPETFIKVSGEKRVVEVRPIAGTRRRGIGADGKIDADLDTRKEAELRLDEKELAEHMMLVDLARNDVARVSKPKTRYVDKLLTVDRYSHVMHLVSYVRGELRDDLDALHAYQASMNMGTLVGAPKVKAAQILREVEKTKRGFYGGAVGYIDREGQMDTAIVIRSALVKNDVAYVRAGAGVVFDSIAHEEVNESKSKAEAVLKAIAMVNP